MATGYPLGASAFLPLFLSTETLLPSPQALVCQRYKLATSFPGAHLR
jgi:hypothetical protein